MTPAELIAEARRISEKATEGPWEADDENGQDVFSLQHKTRVASSDPRWNYSPGKVMCFSNLKFIASSRTLVPQLADALERAMKALEKCKEQRNSFAGSPHIYEEVELFEEDQELEDSLTKKKTLREHTMPKSSNCSVSSRSPTFLEVANDRCSEEKKRYVSERLV